MEEEMANILSGFHRYYATRYSKFKNDLKGHLKKHGESHRPSSILDQHWKKYIEYSKDPYIQVLQHLVLLIHYNCIIYNNINI